MAAKLIQVLLAEDDESSAKLVIHALERYNFHVTHVPDGMAALSKVRMEKFDLVISDIMMPYLDGLSFIEKAQDYLKDMPVIVLTAVGDRKHVLKAAQRHVNQYILKPVEVDALLEKVFSALNLEPEEIVDKRNYPLKKQIQVQNGDTLVVKLEGCPRKNSAEDVFQDIEKVFAKEKGVLQMILEVEPIFFLDGNALRILDDLVLKVIKHSSLRTANIRIVAPEVREWKPDPDKFPNLTSCKIEDRV